jgi:hypothetical protein
MSHDVAVFSRNHRVHLEDAAATASRDPGSATLFRSVKRWVSAAAELKRRGSVEVYFAVIDDGTRVRYSGQIVDLEVDPYPGSSRTAELLQRSGVTTETEGDWNGNVGTLILVKGCHELDRPFEQSELVKLDGSRLSADFIRTYALVRPR